MRTQIKQIDRKKILAEARRVIETEIKNLKCLEHYLDDRFVRVIELMSRVKGKVIVTGIGKSGIIGRKISATLASTGTPSIFLHPGEAVHGDFGVVCRQDIVLAISNSGETEEILRLVPFFKKMNVPIIALTSNPASSLAVQSAVVLETGPIYEADPFSLIPSSSATVALVLGDAIAFTLLNVKGFQKEDYAVYHPGGSLGRRLMLRVRDVMITGKKIPCVPVSATLDDAIREINAKNLGFTIVLDRARRIAGIITDGDLRRLLARRTDLSGATLADCMTTNPRRIEEDKLAVQALAVMEKYEITCLVISTPDGKLKGIVHLHDLLGKRNFAQEF